MRLAVLCCLVLLGVTGCATTGGVEVAGRASQVTPPPVEPPLPADTPKSADPVAVLRADPEVDQEVKAALVPCEGGGYPVDDRFVDLTGDGVTELVVTVYPCRIVTPSLVSSVLGVGLGLAGYVYSLAEDPPVRLLAIEEGGIELMLDAKHQLLALRNRYLARDEPCCPTDHRFVLYVWNGSALVEARR